MIAVQSTMAHSPDLQWMLIKNNSCFLVKNQGTTFTTEPNNVASRNTFKYNGLVNKKTIGVKAAPGGKGVVLSVRKNKVSRKPTKMYNHVTLSKDSRSTVSAIKGMCGKNFYRQDLQDAAAKRACAILRSQNPHAVVQKKRSRRKRN